MNINIKHLSKTSRPLTENPSTGKPGEISPPSPPLHPANPKQIIKKNNFDNVCVLHSLHGQLFGFHFLIAALKGLTVFKSLNSDSTNWHMSGPSYVYSFVHEKYY